MQRASLAHWTLSLAGFRTIFSLSHRGLCLVCLLFPMMTKAQSTIETGKHCKQIISKTWNCLYDPICCSLDCSLSLSRFAPRAFLSLLPSLSLSLQLTSHPSQAIPMERLQSSYEACLLKSSRLINPFSCSYLGSHRILGEMLMRVRMRMRALKMTMEDGLRKGAASYARLHALKSPPTRIAVFLHAN